MNRISRGAWPLAACAAVVLLLAGCNADEPGTIDEALKASDRTATAPTPEDPSPTATATLSSSELQAYNEAVEAAQAARRVEARLYARGKLDAKAERELRTAMMGKALHLTRGYLGVFEKRQWHTEGAITFKPIKPLKVKPGDVNKSNGSVVFLSCFDRSDLWIVGADGKRLEQEGSLRGLSRIAVYESNSGWKLSEIDPAKKKPGAC